MNAKLAVKVTVILLVLTTVGMVASLVAYDRLKAQVDASAVAGSSVELLANFERYGDVCASIQYYALGYRQYDPKNPTHMETLERDLATIGDITPHRRSENNTNCLIYDPVNGLYLGFNGSGMEAHLRYPAAEYRFRYVDEQITTVGIPLHHLPEKMMQEIGWIEVHDSKDREAIERFKQEHGDKLAAIWAAQDRAREKGNLAEIFIPVSITKEEYEQRFGQAKLCQGCVAILSVVDLELEKSIYYVISEGRQVFEDLDAAWQTFDVLTRALWEERRSKIDILNQ